MTPLQMYDWACTSLKAIQFTYCTFAEYSEVKDQLKTRFDLLLQNNSWNMSISLLCPSTSILRDCSSTKIFGINNNFQRRKSQKKKDSELELETISGYVTCMYNNNYWIAFVLDVDV